MIQLLVLMLFALLWPLMVGELSFYNLLVGGFMALLLLSAVRSGGRDFAERLLGFCLFLLVFFWQLLLANIQIAILAFSPRLTFYPHIVVVPLRVKSNAAISLLSATITLLPGTVAMGTSADRQLLYAHAIGIKDPKAARESITAVESLILRFMS